MAFIGCAITELVFEILGYPFGISHFARVDSTTGLSSASCSCDNVALVLPAEFLLLLLR